MGYYLPSWQNFQNKNIGFDKYSEITSEYVIRSTYVDLAIKLDGKLALLIEVKAIGLLSVT